MGIQKNFVVKNGLEVNTDLILADADTNKVGIGITSPQYTLHVFGGIGATTANITEDTTVNNIAIDGRITAGSSLGSSGQYLVSTGAGVTWSNPPALRTTTSLTADIGDITFSVPYRIGLLDVFINGVRLTEDEFIANDSATVTLTEPCFGGETVEFVSYSPSAIIAGTGIGGLSIFEEGSPVGTPALVSSINFVGGAVTAVGSGVGVTVYIDGGSGGTNYWQLTSSGINTISNVGIATTNPRFLLEVGPVGYSGTSLWVNGNARVTGILTIGTSSIVLDGSTNAINVGTGVTILGDTGTITIGSTINAGSSINVGSGVTILGDTGTITIGSTINAGSVVNVGSGITISGNTSTINVGSGVTILGDTGTITIGSTVNVGSSINVGSGISISGDTSTINVGSGITLSGNTGTIQVSSLEVNGEVFSGAAVTSITAGVGITVTKVGGNVDISTTDETWSSIGSTTSTNLKVGIGTDFPQANLEVVGGVNVVGVVTATNGFISVGNTTPIQISLVGDKLTFTASGIGSTTFTLF